MAEERSGRGGGCGCLSVILLMVCAGLVAWSIFGYDPQSAVGVGILGGLGVYAGLVMSPCILAGLLLVGAVVLFGGVFLVLALIEKAKGRRVF